MTLDGTSKKPSPDARRVLRAARRFGNSTFDPISLRTLRPRLRPLTSAAIEAALAELVDKGWLTPYVNRAVEERRYRLR